MTRAFSKLIAAAILLALPIGVPQAMTQEAQSTALSSLRSASGSELEAIVKNYREERQSDIQELMSIVGEQEATLIKTQRVVNNSREWFAIVLLGDIQPAAAAPLLARLISVRDSSFSLVSDEGGPHWYSFPAAVALSKIGIPAVEPLLELARTSSLTSTVFHLCGVTLEATLGEELALSAVKQYARQHPELSQKDRLTALTALVRAGHKRWTAYGASDFLPE